MRTNRMLQPWLAIAVVLGSGCAMRLEDHPARKFEIQGPTAPASCTFDDAMDDRCTLCQKGRCCSEVAACDADCRAGYQRYEACLYTDGSWSGNGTEQCMKEAKVGSMPAVSNLILCFRSQCATDNYCGAEPGAFFAPPANADRISQLDKPQSPADNFSAAQFLERYCNGCHQPQSLSMAADGVTPLTSFTSNFDWFGPRWFQSMDYAAVAGKLDIIACGVRADSLPDECTTLTSVHPGFFTGPAKFPPAHPPAQYGGCWWASNCLQPTPYERVRLLSWIADGAPQ